jgi:hypothetical protein
VNELRDVQITSHSIQLPQHVRLSDQEAMLLQQIQHRLRVGSGSN